MWKFLNPGCGVLVVYQAIYECSIVKFYWSIFFPSLHTYCMSIIRDWYLVHDIEKQQSTTSPNTCMNVSLNKRTHRKKKPRT
jgi:hypothetical protein